MKQRYSLRNQNKIEKAFGATYLELLLKSLNEYFQNTDIIFEYENKESKYKFIHVDSAYPNSEMIFEFYVISKTFDVYNLAYKSSIG